MRLNTDGIVIREQNIGEADRLVTLLTRDYGVVRAFARGARRVKNPALSATQLLSYARFSIFQGRDSYIIDEAEPIEVFFPLREDLQKLSLALYLAELGGELSPELETAEEQLRLLLNCLHLLCENKKDEKMVKAVFELRMLSISGYIPNLVACSECGEFADEVMYFDLVRGSLFCSACQPKYPVERLPIGVVTAMRHIIFSESKKIFNFTLSDGGMNELSRICEKYLFSQTQRRYRTLEFYNSLII